MLTSRCKGGVRVSVSLWVGENEKLLVGVGGRGLWADAGKDGGGVDEYGGGQQDAGGDVAGCGDAVDDLEEGEPHEQSAQEPHQGAHHGDEADGLADESHHLGKVAAAVPHGDADDGGDERHDRVGLGPEGQVLAGHLRHDGWGVDDEQEMAEDTAEGRLNALNDFHGKLLFWSIERPLNVNETETCDMQISSLAEDLAYQFVSV